MIWLTSDWHFNHNKDFVYAARGFDCIDDMNIAIINNFNRYTYDDDDIYVLGDLCLGGGLDEFQRINKSLIESLNGNLHVIIGNHDTDRRIDMYKTCSNVIDIQYADAFKYKKYHFYLSHYPTITSNLDIDKPLKQRTLNLFGHTHQKEKFYRDNPTMYNVGVDAHNCCPVSIEQVIKDITESYKA